MRKSGSAVFQAERQAPDIAGHFPLFVPEFQPASGRSPAHHVPHWHRSPEKNMPYAGMYAEYRKPPPVCIPEADPPLRQALQQQYPVYNRDSNL